MNQTSELLFYFVCMESFRYTQACAGVPEEVFQMSYPEVDFLYLNEEDMVAAGVKDMAGCIDAMEEMFKLMKVGDYRMGGANGNSHGCMVMFPPSSPFPEMPVDGPDRRFMAMPAYLGVRYGRHEVVRFQLCQQGKGSAPFHSDADAER